MQPKAAMQQNWCCFCSEQAFELCYMLFSLTSDSQGISKDASPISDKMK